MNRQIVICRYNEDISWTEGIENVVIYNKGDYIDTKHKVINLPNLGMFHASQFYHIIKNYDNLADITLFLQGWPFDGDFEIYNSWTNNKSDIQKMIKYYSDIKPGRIVSEATYVQKISNEYSCPPNYNQRHHGEFVRYSSIWDEWIKIIDPFDKMNWKKKTVFYRNGHIGLSKEAILSNPIEFYIFLIDFWKYSNPSTEWFGESTHHIMFNAGFNEEYIDYGHNTLDFSNLKDYNEWIYEK